MIDEKEVDIRAQIMALQFAVCELFGWITKMAGPSGAAVLAQVRHWPEVMGQSGIPDTDPVVSDLLTGELENALRALADQITTHVRIAPKQGR